VSHVAVKVRYWWLSMVALLGRGRTKRNCTQRTLRY